MYKNQLKLELTFNETNMTKILIYNLFAMALKSNAAHNWRQVILIE